MLIRRYALKFCQILSKPAAGGLTSVSYSITGLEQIRLKRDCYRESYTSGHFIFHKFYMK